jgi:hypothetical protein
MALTPNKTLQELRDKLRVRLGFGAQSSKSGPQTKILNDFIQEAQEDLYKEVDWKQLRKIWTLKPGIDQQHLDYPDDMGPNRILQIASRSADSIDPPDYSDMTEGIEIQHLNNKVDYDKPTRYELRDQIEIWPIMDEVGTAIRIEGLIRLERFEFDSDRLTVPGDGLVSLLALSKAKNHYRHNDWQEYLRDYNVQLNRAKSRNSYNKRYIRKSDNSRWTQKSFNPTILDQRFDI